MIQSILSNLAVILMSHLAVTTLLAYRERFSQHLLNMYIVIIMSFTVISMFYLPIQFGEFRFDLRLIPLIMLAIFAKGRITISVLIIVCLWRYMLGGEGAIPGILFATSIPTLFALLYIRITGNRKLTWDKVVVVSICWLLSDVPLMFYHQNGEEIFQQIAILRFVSFLLATFLYYIVIEIENSRIRMKHQLEFLATHDPLTSLLNRQECIRRAEARFKLNEKNMQHAVVMLDIDHFKKLNDEYGHAAGDDTLVQMAEILKSFERDTLQVARYGGEEFLLWMCDEDHQSIVGTIEKIQQKIREAKFEVRQDHEISVTVSIGLADWQPPVPMHEAIKEADFNLYEAKEHGRDRIVYRFASDAVLNEAHR